MPRIDVRVMAAYDFDGRCVPLKVALPNGRILAVDRVIGKPYTAASLSAGGQGACFDCEIGNKRVRLFCDRNDPKDGADMGIWYLDTANA